MTGRLTYAGADRASWRTDENRRRKDLAFLDELRAAGMLELLMLRRAFAANGPQWKRVAVERAISRVAATTKETRR